MVSEVGTLRLTPSLIKVRRTELPLTPGHWPRPFSRMSPRVGIAPESQAAGPTPRVPRRALQWNVPRRGAEGWRSPEAVARSGLPYRTFARVTPAALTRRRALCWRGSSRGPARRPRSWPPSAVRLPRRLPPPASPLLSPGPASSAAGSIPAGTRSAGTRSAAARLRPPSPRRCSGDPAGDPRALPAPHPRHRGGLTGHAQGQGGRAPREPSACNRRAGRRPSRGAARRRPRSPTPWPA